MTIGKEVISRTAPGMKNCLWAKPSDGGFVLYMNSGGGWSQLKVEQEDVEAPELSFDALGAAEEVKKALIGSKKDSKKSLTLYGLKAYIDDALSNLG